MKLLELIRGVIFQPGVTFENFELKAGLRQAAAFVAVSGACLALGYMFPVVDPAPGGVFLLIAFNVCLHLALWLLIGFLCYLPIHYFLRGCGELRNTIAVCGFCYFPWLLMGLLAAGLKTYGFWSGMFDMFAAFWFILLLCIAMVSVHEISLGRALGIVIPVCLVAMLANVALQFYDPRILITPLISSRPPALIEKAFETESWTRAPEGAVNVMKKSDFETVVTKENGEVDDENWDIFKMPWPKIQIGIDRTIKHSGEASGVIRRTGAADNTFKFLRQGVEDLTPGRDLFLSAWLRAEDVSCAVILARLMEKQAPEKPEDKARYLPTKELWRGNILTGAQDWTEMRIKLRAPNAPFAADVIIMLWGKGTLWVDDVEMYQVPDKPAEPSSEKSANPDSAVNSGAADATPPPEPSIPAESQPGTDAPPSAQ